MIKRGDVIKSPIVTEKTVANTGKYAFRVDMRACKKCVKQAVEDFYGVKVDSVNIITLPAKTRVVGRGRILVKRPDTKKAIVSLKDKAVLDFNAFQ